MKLNYQSKKGKDQKPVSEKANRRYQLQDLQDPTVGDGSSPIGIRIMDGDGEAIGSGKEDA